MKRILTVLLLTVFFLPGCRKGENDPLISLIPRKARLTGSWTLSTGNGYQYREIEVGAHVTELTEEWTFDGQDLELIETDENGSQEFIYPYKMKFVLNKDNSFTMTRSREFNAAQDGEDYTQEVDWKGTWKFTGGGEHKNKSQLLIQIREETIVEDCNGCGTTVNTYSENSARSMVVDLDRLKNREMVWKFGGRTVEGNITDSTYTEYRFIKD